MKKYKDLGLQTLASIARAAHPMHRYKEIVEGFPKVCCPPPPLPLMGNPARL